MAWADLLPEINSVYRDYVTQGLPASGRWEPRKQEIRALLAEIIIGIQAGEFEEPPGWAELLAEVVSLIESIDSTASAAAAAAAAAALAKTAAEAAAAGLEGQASAATAAKLQAVAAAAAAAADAATVLAAIEAATPTHFPDTKAAATAAVGTYANGDVVEVLADESRGGERTRYLVVAGALVYKLTLTPGLVSDAVGRKVLPKRLLGRRSTGLKVHKTLADLRNGVRSSARILTIGDSLAGIDWATPNQQFQRVVAGHMLATPVYHYGNDILLPGDTNESRLAAHTATPRTYDGVYNFKTDYDVSWTGSNVELGSGKYVIFSVGGNCLTADRILIPVVTESGAGAVHIEIAESPVPLLVGDGGWREVAADEIASAHTLTGGELIVDADAALGLDMVELTLDLARYCVKVTQVSGGAVRVLDQVMHEVTTQPAINTYRLNAASNDFASALSGAEPVMAGLIGAYDPDVIFIESDDKLGGYQSFLPMLESAIATAGLAYPPAVILVLNPFYSNGGFTDADIAARNDFCIGFCDSRMGWDYIDAMAFAGGLPEATLADWENDGIHWNGELSWQVTKAWAMDRGYYALEAVRPGGDASFSDIVRSRSNRLVRADRIHALLSDPAILDTASMTWSYLTANSGAGTRGAASIVLASGSTASSTVVAYINEANSPLGFDQGNRPLGYAGGLGIAVKVPTRLAAGVARVLWASDRAYNAAYAGQLTAAGVGFEIDDNVVKGIAWHAGAVVESADTVAMTGDGSARWYDLQVILTPETVDASNGTVEWFVNGESLGTASYLHSTSASALRVELTNGATAANYAVSFAPPRIVTVR